MIVWVAWQKALQWCWVFVHAADYHDDEVNDDDNEDDDDDWKHYQCQL